MKDDELVNSFSQSLYFLLRSRLGDYVDAAEIADATGVADEGVVALVAALSDDGAPIETHPILGCRLTGVPETLLASEISFELQTAWCGRQLRVEETVSSTNDTARRWSENGAPEGALVVAEVQTAGRGRRGRRWHSARGDSLLFSVVLRPPAQYLETGFLTLLLATSIARAMRMYCQIQVRIKWPNDLVLAPAKGDEDGIGIPAELKLGGILCERMTDAALIAGIGINVNQSSFSAEFLPRATSIRRHTGAPVNRCLLLKRILLEIERDYECAAAGGESMILGQARSLSPTCGHAVEIETESGRVRGTALDIDQDGALLVQGADPDPTKPLRVTAGDVVAMTPESSEKCELGDGLDAQ